MIKLEKYSTKREEGRGYGERERERGEAGRERQRERERTERVGILLILQQDWLPFIIELERYLFSLTEGREERG
jgi:hypothetical protein